MIPNTVVEIPTPLTWVMMTRLRFAHQSLVLLLITAPDHLGEVHQGPGQVVSLGLLVGVMVLDLEQEYHRNYNLYR